MSVEHKLDVDNLRIVQNNYPENEVDKEDDPLQNSITATQRHS